MRQVSTKCRVKELHAVFSCLEYVRSEMVGVAGVGCVVRRMVLINIWHIGRVACSGLGTGQGAPDAILQDSPQNIIGGGRGPCSKAAQELANQLVTPTHQVQRTGA